MFALKGAEIGARNEAAVREALESRRVRVTATDTGSATGRSMSVNAPAGTVTARVAAGSQTTLLPPRSTSKEIA